MSIVLDDKGAFTWNVKRQIHPTKLHEDYISFFNEVYQEVANPLDQIFKISSDQPSSVF